MAKGKRSKTPVDEVKLAAASDRYVTALTEHRGPWATSTQVGFPSTNKLAGPIVKRLVEQRRIVGLGKVKGAEAYALLGSETADERLRSLAAGALAARCRTDKLDLLPLSADNERYKGLPPKLRKAIVQLLRDEVKRKAAFPVRAGGNCVVLAENLRALLAASDGPDVIEKTPSQPSTSLDPSSVVRAYENLALERRSPNIVVSELQRRAGVDLAALQGWLLAECRAHRAVPLLGEPAHATPEQLAAALVVEGRPHLYVRLLQEQQP